MACGKRSRKNGGVVVLLGENEDAVKEEQGQKGGKAHQRGAEGNGISRACALLLRHRFFKRALLCRADGAEEKGTCGNAEEQGGESGKEFLTQKAEDGFKGAVEILVKGQQKKDDQRREKGDRQTCQHEQDGYTQLFSSFARGDGKKAVAKGKKGGTRRLYCIKEEESARPFFKGVCPRSVAEEEECQKGVGDDEQS